MSIKICIDAGHYGKYNRSPVNNKYYESDMTWKLHGYLKAALLLYGFAVVTTRKDQGKDLSLMSRGKAAKGCDLFISLHSNACGSDVKNPEAVDHPLACCTVTGKADVIGKQLADTVARVMGTAQSGRITKKIGNDGKDWYTVLRGAAAVGVPGVLLEHSFHTNSRATAWLLSDANLRKLAEAEAACIAAYFGIEKPVQTVPTSNSFLVKVICTSLNVRAGAGTAHKIKTVVHKNEVYTIVETKQVGSATWGKLKSGAGWINIGSSYCKKL